MHVKSKSSGAQRVAQADRRRLAPTLAVLLDSSYMLHRFSSTLSRRSSAGCALKGTKSNEFMSFNMCAPVAQQKA